VTEILKSMTIEVPIEIVASELKDLFTIPRSLELMRGFLPDYDVNHKIVEMDRPTHMVYDDGGLRANIDLTLVGKMTRVTIRVPYDSSSKGAAAVAVLAQLCAFESLEQGYKAALRSGIGQPQADKGKTC